MALNAKKAKSTGGAKSEPLAPENYMGRLVQVIDLGLQARDPYKGKAKDPCQMVWVTYELGTEFMKDEDGNDDPEHPRWLSEKFPLMNLKAEKAKSTLRYNGLDPKGEHEGDWAELGAAPCLIAVVNNEKNGVTYNNIGGISPPIKGIPVPELVRPFVLFDLDTPDMEVYEGLPDFLKETILENLNFRGSPLEAALNLDTQVGKTQGTTEEGEIDDDLPL